MILQAVVEERGGLQDLPVPGTVGGHEVLVAVPVGGGVRGVEN